VAWRPQYRFRAGKGENDQIRVEYLAGVVQQTGEEWNNVKLTLSTAQPRLNAAPPQLRTLSVALMPREPGTPGLQIGQTGALGAQGGNAGVIGNLGAVGAVGNVGALGALGGALGQQGGMNSELQQAVRAETEKLRKQAAESYSKKDS